MVFFGFMFVRSFWRPESRRLRRQERCHPQGLELHPSLRQSEGYEAVSGCSDHVLLAIDRVGDEIRFGVRSADCKFPQQLAGFGVEREEIAFVASGEDQAARR